MNRRRLDNGRSTISHASSQQGPNRQGDTQSQPGAHPQTFPLSLKLLHGLFNNHNWSTYRDDQGEITTLHVETKEGQDRFKYILGMDGLSGNPVLLSKQQHLSPKSRPFITLKVKCQFVARHVAVLIKPDMSQTSTRASRKIALRNRPPQQPAGAGSIVSRMADRSPSTENLKRESSQDEAQSERSNPRSNTIGLDGASSTSQDKTAAPLSDITAVNVLCKSKRKQPPPDSYTMSTPLDLCKKRCSRKSAITKAESLAPESDLTTAAPASISRISSDEGAIPYGLEQDDPTDFGLFSDEETSLGDAPLGTATDSKPAHVEYWVGGW